MGAVEIPGGAHQTARLELEVIDGGRDARGNPIVVAGEGTGIVNIAPGCGDVDHEKGTRLGLPKLSPLDEAADRGWVVVDMKTDWNTVYPTE